MEIKNPTAPATEKQIAYINELIRSTRMDYWRKADAVRATTTPELLAHPDNRHYAARLAAAELMVRVYETIQVPELNQKQASTWIDALKGGTLIDTALDKPAAAARMGLTTIIAEVGEKAIDEALRG